MKVQSERVVARDTNLTWANGLACRAWDNFVLSNQFGLYRMVEIQQLSLIDIYKATQLGLWFRYSRTSNEQDVLTTLTRWTGQRKQNIEYWVLLLNNRSLRAIVHYRTDSVYL